MQNEIYLGIEIGGSKLQIVSGCPDGSLMSTHRFAVTKENGARGIQVIIEKTLREYQGKTVKAIGVGFGGPVNRFTGQIATSFHIEGWSGFNIKSWLESIINVPAFIDNDANVAALGEAIYGAGSKYNSVLYITLGSGVGGGFVVDQKLYHGAIPGEIEIGHIQMDRNGTTLQSLCSGWAVDEKVRKSIVANPDGILARLSKNNKFPEAYYLNEAINLNDPVAWEVLEETTADLAYAFSHAIHLLHPDVLVLGGGLSFLGEPFRRSIEAKLPGFLMNAFSPGPPILISELKERAVPLGCLVLSQQNMQKQ